MWLVTTLTDCPGYQYVQWQKFMSCIKNYYKLCFESDLLILIVLGIFSTLITAATWPGRDYGNDDPNGFYEIQVSYLWIVAYLRFSTGSLMPRYMEKTCPEYKGHPRPLPAESTLARVYMGKKLTPLHEPTALANALIFRDIKIQRRDGNENV